MKEISLKEQLRKAHAENVALKEQLQQKEEKVATMEYLCIESLQHRFPSDPYVVYLKEKWLLFQIKTLASHGSLPFQDCSQFMNFYKQDNMVDQEKMAEFYVHKFVLTNLDIWDLNPTMGDMQLMALASWMVNEDTREKEIWKVMGRRKREPLYIRLEFLSPRGVILNHQEIERDHAMAESYLKNQNQVIVHFVDVYIKIEE